VLRKRDQIEQEGDVCAFGERLVEVGGHLQLRKVRDDLPNLCGVAQGVCLACRRVHEEVVPYHTVNRVAAHPRLERQLEGIAGPVALLQRDDVRLQVVIGKAGLVLVQAPRERLVCSRLARAKERACPGVVRPVEGL